MPDDAPSPDPDAGAPARDGGASSAREDGSSRGPRRLVAALTGIQALALVGFALFYVVELVLGEGSDPARVVMSAVLILLGGVGLAALTRGWLAGGRWPRTPTLVWSALLVPVGFGLVQGNQAFVGWLVLGLATLTAVSALRVPMPAEPLPGADTDRSADA